MLNIDSFKRLPTERPHNASRDLDRKSFSQLVSLMNRADREAVEAVAAVKRDIVRAVRLVAQALAGKKRVLFFGAGTSGRLCLMEAAECPPTFSTSPDMIKAFMAGGPRSVFHSREGAEDRALEAEKIVRRQVKKGDAVVGVAASGVTPFVLAALLSAKRRGAKTILVTCNPRSPLKGLAHVVIAPHTGSEILTGSTRLKAGTASKMILNTLTTLAMVRLGKVYKHWMVDLAPRSQKLVARGLRLIGHLGRASEADALRLFKASGGRVKTAIVMARRGLSRRSAEKLLKSRQGFLRRVLN